MTEFDIDVLKFVCDQEVSNLIWGAAMSESLEYLQEMGYVSTSYDPTSKATIYKPTKKGKLYVSSLERFENEQN